MYARSSGDEILLGHLWPTDYLDDCCRLVLPYSAVHSIQQTELIPNDPPQMVAKSTTTSNHRSTPGVMKSYWELGVVESYRGLGW